MPGSSVVREDQRFFFVKPSVPNGNIHAYPGTRAIVVSSWEWLLERILRREIVLGMVGKDRDAAQRAIASREAAYSLDPHDARPQEGKEADGYGVGAGLARVVDRSSHPSSPLPSGDVEYSDGVPTDRYYFVNLSVPWTDLAGRTLGLLGGLRNAFCDPDAPVPEVVSEGSAVLSSTCLAAYAYSGPAYSQVSSGGQWSSRSSIGIVPMGKDNLPVVRFLDSHRVYDRPRTFDIKAWNEANGWLSRVHVRAYPATDQRPFDSDDAAAMPGRGVRHGPLELEVPAGPGQSVPARTVRVVADNGHFHDVVAGVPACLAADRFLAPFEVTWRFGQGLVEAPPWVPEGDRSAGHLADAAAPFAYMPREWLGMAGVTTEVPPVSRRPGALMAVMSSSSVDAVPSSQDTVGFAVPGLLQVADRSIGAGFGLRAWLSPNPDWDGKPTYWASRGFPHSDACGCGQVARDQLAAIGHAQPTIPSRSVPLAAASPAGREPFFPAAVDCVTSGRDVPPMLAGTAAGSFRHRFCASEPVEISGFLDCLSVTVHKVSAVSFRVRGMLDAVRTERSLSSYDGGDLGSDSESSSSGRRTVVDVEGYRYWVSSSELVTALDSILPMNGPAGTMSLFSGYSDSYMDSGVDMDQFGTSTLDVSRTERADRTVSLSDVALMGSVVRGRRSGARSWTRTRTRVSGYYSPGGSYASSQTAVNGEPGPEADPSETLLAAVSGWVDSAEAFVVGEVLVADESDERSEKTESAWSGDVNPTSDESGETSDDLRERRTVTIRRRLVATSLGPVDPATGRLRQDISAEDLLERLAGVRSADRRRSSGRAGRYSSRSESRSTDTSDRFAGAGAAYRHVGLFVRVSWKFDAERPPDAGAGADDLAATLGEIASRLRSARSEADAVVARAYLVSVECSNLSSTLDGYERALSGQAASDVAVELRAELSLAMSDLQSANAGLATAEADLRDAEDAEADAVEDAADARRRAAEALSGADPGAYEAAVAVANQFSVRLSSAIARRASAEIARTAAADAADAAQARVDELAGAIREAEEAEDAALETAQALLETARAAVADALEPAEAALDACNGPEGHPDAGFYASLADAENRLSELYGMPPDRRAKAAARELLARVKGLEETISGLKSGVDVAESGPTSLVAARAAVADARIAVAAWQMAGTAAPS